MCEPALWFSSRYHLCAYVSNYLNQFYNSQQSTLKQEVCTPNNGLLNYFFSFPSSSVLYVSSLPYNSALLASEGETWGW